MLAFQSTPPIRLSVGSTCPTSDPSQAGPIIPDETAYQRFRTRLFDQHGHLFISGLTTQEDAADEIAFRGFRDLLYHGEDALAAGNENAAGVIRYCWRRMEDDWNRYIASQAISIHSTPSTKGQ